MSRYNKNEPTNMAIIDVGLYSGFVPIKEDLDQVKIEQPQRQFANAIIDSLPKAEGSIGDGSMASVFRLCSIKVMEKLTTY